MSDLIVFCNSLDDVVEYKSDHGVLCTMRWDRVEDVTGFYIKNSDILVESYQPNFYIMDEVASVQFIINVADFIMKDQDLDNIIFLNSNKEEKDLPYFLPSTIEDDEDVVILPHQQIAMVQLWSEYILNFHGYLNVDLIDAAADRGILDGFLDLVNAELSLLNKGESDD